MYTLKRREDPNDPFAFPACNQKIADFTFPYRFLLGTTKTCCHYVIHTIATVIRFPGNAIVGQFSRTSSCKTCQVWDDELARVAQKWADQCADVDYQVRLRDKYYKE